MSEDTLSIAGQWRIHLFGPLEVERPTGERVRLNGKKAGELLACLALSPGQASSRERLMTLLWGDTEVGNARTRLRQEIATLRALFAADIASSSLLHITPNELHIETGAAIDAVRLLQLCSEAKQEADEERKGHLLSEIRSLYRADLLTEYDAGWITGERVRFSRCYEQALQALAEEHRQRRDYAGAEETLYSLLAHNPLNEESHIALMRLYAEQGRPTQVQQQYQALERALQESVGLAPTEGTRRLAETLRESAGHCAAMKPAPVFLQSDDEIPMVTEADFSEPIFAPRDGLDTTDLLDLPAESSARPVVRRRRVAILLPVFLLLALSAGIGFWKTSHRPRPHPASAPALLPIPSSPAPVPTFSPKWVYYYKPQPGEKPNSEGCSIASSWSTDGEAIYVTGLIQTEKEDVNILTLKLSKEKGELIWADSYDSHERDCDRASSLCLDGKQGLYVLGESYLPSKDSWHLTLLYYDAKGKRCWHHHSTLPVQQSQVMKVCSDEQGGCYIAGTALVKGRQAVLVSRYDRTGKQLWEKTVPEGSPTSFHWLAVNPQGMLYLCGTSSRGEGGSVNDDWWVACLDPTGEMKWHQTEDTPAHRSDTADRMGLDHGGNVLVAGVFDTGDPAQGGTGRNLGLVKYSPEGKRLWEKSIAKDTGPNVCLNSLASNFEGSVALGGTEQKDNGSKGIVLVRYDSNGYQKQTWRYPPSPDYNSSALGIVNIGGNNGISFMGLVSHDPSMKYESTLLVSSCGTDGSQGSQLLFNPVPGQPNKLADFVWRSGGYLTGQVGIDKDKRSLFVLYYDPDSPK